MLQVSALDLEKQKSFIPKKIFLRHYTATVAMNELSWLKNAGA